MTTTPEQKRLHADYMREWRKNNLDRIHEIEKKTRERPEYKEYMREYLRKYRKDFPEKYKALLRKNRDKAVERKRIEKKNDKEIVYSHYGNVCVCCGEGEKMFLTIDHIDNDGNSDRRINGAHIYRRLINNGFPDNFQVLCRNCNWGKHINGGICPHKTKDKQ